MDIARYLPIVYPQALCLGFVLAWLYAKRLRNRNFWRLMAVIAAIILLCYPVLRRSSKGFDLYVLVDRSRSISEAGGAKQVELIDMIARKLDPDEGDRLGVVSFNERAYIEQAPNSEAATTEFQIPYSVDASDLTDGLRTILNMIGEANNAKVLVLSDGEYTGRNPVREAQAARQRKIPIHYRNLKRAEFFNLSLRDVETPGKILSNEPFRVVFKVHSTVSTPGRYRLYRNNRIVGQEESQGWRQYDFKVGENEILFVDNLKNAGVYPYRLEVESVPRDQEKVLKDNTAEHFVKVVGERPLLVVNNTGQADNVSRILSAGNLPVHIVNIGEYRLDIQQLDGYKGVILNNVSVLDLPARQIDSLRAFVEEEGGGLLVCGGNRSFSKGGYYRSSLDPILPVSLEDRQQSKKVSTAFSMVMDRSGSMSMPTPSGETKIELANAAIVESIGLMNASDSLSVIAVDSSAHVMVPQQNVTDPDPIIQKVRTIKSMGGGIFVYVALVEAGRELMKSTQINKHILLFSDSRDTERPEDYKKLIEEYVKVGITISVIGLGEETDCHAELLKDIAKRGQGSVYFTNEADRLVQFFTADTITYTRNSFVDEPTNMAIRSGASTIAPEQRWKDFTASGYNLLFTRPKASVAIQTVDEDAAPILAFWQRGLGRVATLACDTGGSFSGIDEYGDIMLNTARWIMGSSVHDSFQVKIGYEGNYARVQMEVSEEERERLGQAKVAIHTPSGKTIFKPLQWDSHNRLSTDLKLTEPGCYRGTIRIGDRTIKIDPMAMPVSPEFAHDREPNFGKAALSRVAEVTGGKAILDIRELFQRDTQTHVIRPALFPFLVVLLLMILLDIAEARFGLILQINRFAQARVVQAKTAWAARGQRQAARPPKPKKKPKKTEPKRRSKKYDGEAAADAAGIEILEPEEEPVEEEPAPEPEKEETGDLGYLSRSKEKSDRRFGGR